MAEEHHEARMVAHIQGHDLRFDRCWFYLLASVMCWGVFWALADQHHENGHAQFLVWTIILAAAWLTDNM